MIVQSRTVVNGMERKKTSQKKIKKIRIDRIGFGDWLDGGERREGEVKYYF